MMEELKDRFKSFFQCRGCLGCCAKPPVVICVDEPSGLVYRGQSWSSSTSDMDNSAVQSQRSASSISTSNQTLDPHRSTGSSTEFVNHGLLLWNQTRQQWTANKSLQKRTQARERRIRWNATYDSLLGTNKPLQQPIPLPEMVDFLTAVWAEEGLYD